LTLSCHRTCPGKIVDPNCNDGTMEGRLPHSRLARARVERFTGNNPSIVPSFQIQPYRGNLMSRSTPTDNCRQVPADLLDALPEPASQLASRLRAETSLPAAVVAAHLIEAGRTVNRLNKHKDRLG